MGGYLLLNIPAGIGCLFPKFILALPRYGIVSKNFIGFLKNFHTSLVLLLGSKRVILFLAFKNQIPCCDIYHHSHSLKKSNNCPETITSFPVLSWNSTVLWGFWNNQNQWFFHSDFFSHTQNRGCLVLISSNTQKPACWVWISQPPAIGVYYKKSNAHPTLDFKPYFICTPIWRVVNSHIGNPFPIWKGT